MNPLVSILIPAYNSERWIGGTIESALRQTWENIEIIIVDDGSADHTYDIAKTYQSPRVKVLTQENQGAPATRNNLFKLSQGDYVQWLDADDLLDPDKIANQLKNSGIKDDPMVLLTASFGTFYFRIEKATFNPNSLWQDLTPIEWILNKFNDNVWMNPTAWLVSRELTQLAGPWNVRLAKSGDDDGEYICRIIKHCKRVKFVPDAKCYYRIGSLSSLNWQSGKALDSLFLSLKLSIDHLLDIENSENTRKACLKYLQTWYIFFYPDGNDTLDQVKELADRLGGRLTPPEFKLKYLPFKILFGNEFAKKMSDCLPKIKMKILKNYDYFMYKMLQPIKSKGYAK